MYRLIRTLAVAIVCVSGVVACSSDDDTATTTNDPSPTEPPTTVEPAGTTDVVGTTEVVETTEPVQATEPAPSTIEPVQLPPLVTFDVADIMAAEQIGGVVVGDDGTVWAIGEGDPVVEGGAGENDPGLRYSTYAYFDGTGWIDVDAPDPVELGSYTGVFGMDPEGGPDRTLWLITTGFGSSPGLYFYDGEKWSTSTIPWDIVTGESSPDGSLWAIRIGSEPEGINLVRFDGKAWTPQPAPPGGIRCVFCVSYETDAEGLLWMQNEIGISSYDGDTWTPLPVSLPDDVVSDAAISAPKWTLGVDGSHWLVYPGDGDADPVVGQLLLTLTRIAGDEVISIPIGPSPDPVSPDSIYSVVGLAGDTQGRFWAAVDGRGLWRFDVETGETLTYGIESAQNPSQNQQGGLPSLEVRGIAAHPDGSVWVATSDGITRIQSE